MLTILNENSQIRSIGPNYLNLINKSNKKNYKIVDYLITSGNLTYISDIERINGFNTNLFINSIDFSLSI